MATGKVGQLPEIALVALLVLGCGSSSGKPTGTGGTGAATGGQGGTGGATGGQDGGNSQTTTKTFAVGQPDTKVDILFVIDNWGSTTEWNLKLADQLPTFVQVLKSSPIALDLHIAVVDTDMGAPSDVQASIMCSPTGDDGAFQYAPSKAAAPTPSQWDCASATLAPGATYLADDGNGNTNFTAAIGQVLQCIAFLPDSGCGFGQPLAAAVHALGADDVQAGTPTPPSTNIGFLRQDAFLAVIVLANQDDCSVPADTELFSLQGQPDNLTNPLGPFEHYRCNRYGHLCKDPTSASPNVLISPPLTPPSDARGTATAPTLDLTQCQDNDTSSGLLTPVSTFVDQIEALKTDPDNQILVAAIVAPTSPYTVAWIPAQGSQDTQPGELWPEVLHSCGAPGPDLSPDPSTQHTTDGSFGDPGVRLAQFTSSFSDSVLASICDPSYAQSMTAIATKIAQSTSSRNCVTGTIQPNGAGNPNCTVSAQVPGGTTTKTVSYPYCGDDGNVPPCWSLTPGTGTCDGQEFTWVETTPSSSISLTCSLCNVGAYPPAPGCPFP